MRASTGVCHYEIDWSTEVACKHNKEEAGSCIISNTHSGVQYDFTPLANQSTVSKMICIQLCRVSHFSLSHVTLGVQLVFSLRITTVYMYSVHVCT